MTRISMDLRVDPRDSADRRSLVYPMHRETMTETCVEMMRRLGKMATAINAFRVEFSDGDSGNPNCEDVTITIYFEDALDKKRTRKMNYLLGPHCIPGETYRQVASDLLRDGTLENCLRTLVEEGQRKHQQHADKFAGML